MSDVLVPPLGQTTDTVTLVRWYKQEGEHVQAGEPLFAIETDKAILDVEAQDTGTLQAVSASAGQPIHVLTAIAVIAAAGAGTTPKPAGALLTKPDAKPSTPAAPHATRPTVGSGATRPRRQGAESRLLISPRARRLAEQEHAPLEQITPSGPEGAIVERDVRRFLASRPAAAERATGVAGRATGVAPTGSAPVTITREVDAGALLDLCVRLREGGLDVTPSAVVLHALTRALREAPALNATLQEDGIHVWREVHIGLVLAGPAGECSAVLRDAAAKGLAQVAREMRDLGAQAQAGTLTAEEQQGATITVHDLGALGVDTCTPLLAPDQAAAFSLGRIAARSIVRGGQLQSGHTLWISLTFDHRIVDGAPAARCLQRLAQILGAPHLLYAM
jgi:pyruvate dehydrogenase E2 component (dihydrolipoamide acetyltransferase)